MGLGDRESRLGKQEGDGVWPSGFSVHLPAGESLELMACPSQDGYTFYVSVKPLRAEYLCTLSCLKSECDGGSRSPKDLSLLAPGPNFCTAPHCKLTE